MSFETIVTDDAERDIKQLGKRYRSFKSDFNALLNSLEENPQQGEALGKDCFKVRMAIASKQKGKSGGARVITCVKIVASQVFIIPIYDKSELASLTYEKKLNSVCKMLGFNRWYPDELA